MKKIYKILSICSILLLVSACYNSGTKLDKNNVAEIDKATSKNAVNQVNQVSSTAAATSNTVTQAAKQLP